MNEKTQWSHLPNAVHIDRVLASVTAYPKIWEESRVSIEHYQGWLSAYRSVLKYSPGDISIYSSVMESIPRSHGAAPCARSVIFTLIVWDDCAQYLDMTGDQLEMWYHLTERPACLLLLPAVMAFEQIKEMEMA